MEVNAAMTAWLGGVSGVAGWISFRIKYYFWTVFWKCSKNFMKCGKIVLDVIMYGCGVYEIRKEFFNK